jgi:hypothetical protein
MFFGIVLMMIAFVISNALGFGDVGRFFICIISGVSFVVYIFANPSPLDYVGKNGRWVSDGLRHRPGGYHSYR